MVGGEVFGEGRGDRCDPGGEAYLADGGGQRQRSTLATGRSGGRSARNEPDFVRRARDVTGTLTVTEPKRRAVARSAQVCARPGNHAPEPQSNSTVTAHSRITLDSGAYLQAQPRGGEADTAGAGERSALFSLPFKDLQRLQAIRIPKCCSFSQPIHPLGHFIVSSTVVKIQFVTSTSVSTSSSSCE